MNRIITVYEHDTLKIEHDSKLWKSILHFHSINGDKYFSIIFNGIKLKQYVGIIRFESTTIEILPKVDKENASSLRSILMEILVETNPLNLSRVGNSFQYLKRSSLIDYFFLLFLNQTEKLLHQGLTKKYGVLRINSETIRGKILFSDTLKRNAPFLHKHVQEKIDYNINNLENQIIKLTLKIIIRLSRTQSISNRAKELHKTFEQVSDIQKNKINIRAFTKLFKSDIYRDILKLSEIIISGFLPDLRSGKEEAISLLFDMNKLYESLVYRRLQKLSYTEEDLSVNNHLKNSKKIWKDKLIKPDIVIQYKGNKFILDTKWKVPNPFIPSDNDIKQMFVYGLFYNSKLNVLIYPESENSKAEAIPFREEFEDIYLATFPTRIVENGKLSTSFGKEILRFIDQYAKN